MTALLLATILTVGGAVQDSIVTPAVISSVRQSRETEALPLPVTEIMMKDLEDGGVDSQDMLSGMVPSLHIPDYGASMTSTIYMRGLGSRMENPVLGLYIDDIPVLDKNSYDFDYSDIRSAQLFRGPQGTLYGRNSMCGVLSLTTLAPGDYEGWRGAFETGSAARIKARLSHYGEHHSLSALWRSENGFFTNSYDSGKCDSYRGGALRWKYRSTPADNISFDNTLSVTYSSEGAFPYGQYVSGELMPVNYNDEGSYRRLSILEGAKLHRRGERTVVDLIGSLQCLADDMHMDQDYTSAPVFTLRQRQRSAAATAELILRPAAQAEHWHRTTGVYGYYKYNDMYAPVNFLEAGIRTLMEDNANAHIPAMFGKLDITDDSIAIPTDFALFSWNAAVYHESILEWGRWSVTLGLRMDYEGGYMDYDSQATLHYMMVPAMSQVREVSTDYDGSKLHGRFVVLPKLAALYKFPLSKGGLSAYASVSKGYRAGGFNTQIFSDLLQQRVSEALMNDMGVHLSGNDSVTPDDTEYKPEEAWNYETGLRYHRGGWHLEGVAFVMDCINQQLTVFPPGKSTGRMMTNAGRSLSYGTELEASWQGERFGAEASWGWSHARFTKYTSGDNDYAGKHVPYSPEHTLYISAHYRQPLSGTTFRALSFHADCRAAGPNWWDEANTLHQDLYATLGARIGVSVKDYEIYVRGENLMGTDYRTFYFKSMGNEFFQKGKPARVYTGIKFNF